jgi:hypothetical protein
MGHDHSHDHVDEQADLPPALDLSVPDEALTPGDQSRRSFLRRAGVLGIAAAATGMLSNAGQAVGAGRGPGCRRHALAGRPA